MQDFHGCDATDAGQVDVHQNHRRLIDARKLDTETTVRHAHQVQVGAAREELLDQFQIGGIVFHVEHGAHGRASRSARRSRIVDFCDRKLLCSGKSQLDPEHRTHPNGAIHADGAAHQFDQPLRDHQADARAFLRTGLLAETIEWLKKLRNLFGCQPRPGITDADPHRIRRTLGALDGHRTAGRVVLDGVDQQVDQNLFEPNLISFDKTGIFESRKYQADAALLSLRVDHGPALEHDVG